MCILDFVVPVLVILRQYRHAEVVEVSLAFFLVFCWVGEIKARIREII